ncbi:type IV pilin protein [Vreelandella sp. EE7]
MANFLDHRAGASTHQRGFTLIEMLIVAAIIGLLAGIAYPGYQRYVENAVRTDGKAGLLNAAAELERCYARNYSYENGCSITETSPDGHYALTFEPNEEQGGFLILANTSRDDGCDNPLTLNALGERGPEECW